MCCKSKLQFEKKDVITTISNMNYIQLNKVIDSYVNKLKRELKRKSNPNVTISKQYVQPKPMFEKEIGDDFVLIFSEKDFAKIEICINAYQKRLTYDRDRYISKLNKPSKMAINFSCFNSKITYGKLCEEK